LTKNYTFSRLIANSNVATLECARHASDMVKVTEKKSKKLNNEVGKCGCIFEDRMNEDTEKLLFQFGVIRIGWFGDMIYSVEGAVERARTWKGKTHRKIRYAKFPPNCEAMRKANEKLWANHHELRRRKLTMSPDKNEAKLREEWMDYYSDFCGNERDKYITTVDPHLKPGVLAKYCRDKTVLPPVSSTGDLVVIVLGESDKRLPNANVQLGGEHLSEKKKTDKNGVVKFEDLKAMNYQVYAWKWTETEHYAVDMLSVEVQARRQPPTEAIIKLKQIKPCRLVVMVKDWDSKKINQAKITLLASKSDGKPVFYPGATWRTVYTERDGRYVFENISQGYYKLKAEKQMNEYKGYTIRNGPYTVWSDPKLILINPGATSTVELNLKEPPKTKSMKIRVLEASWWCLSYTIVDLLAYLKADIVFQIWDLETNRKRNYRAIPKWLLAVSIGTPFSGARTLKPGPWTNPWEVPRFVEEKIMDENGFEGEIGVKTGSTTGIVNMFFNVTFYEIPFPTGIWQHIPLMRVKVVGIEVGEATKELPSNTVTGTTRTTLAKI
jgi:hypothetical protein